MLGAIIGDIVGSRFEFNNTNKTDFQFFTYECSYTDDTICTVAIADAILKGKNYKDSLHDWCRRYPNPKGAYGSLFSRWVRSDNPKPYNSFGNGSAMRVSPVAWAFPTIEDVYENAMLSAEVTHNHPEGIKGARCVAALIYCLLNKHISKNEVSKFILRHYAYSLRPLSQIIIANGFDETCQTTVPIAIRCFLDSNSFEETIRLAVSVGGDSDTIAAIAGSIAESYYPIPPKIKKEAIYYLPDDMKQVIGEFTMKFNHNTTMNND